MSKKKKCCEGKIPERLNKVGGQAVLEGVMMKAGTRTVTTCRKPDGTIAVYDGEFHSVRKKHKILNIPILRGVINFVEMMILSVKTLGNSADAMGIEEEDGKTEQWMKKHLGVRLTDVIMVISVILGLALSVFLFMYLPSLISGLINTYIAKDALGLWTAVVEGVIKISIFILYLWLVSLMPDIKRTFMYHGAEHKSIACFESGTELSASNAKNYTRFHPRCGTSFMFFMILLGVFAGLFVKMIFPGLKPLAYTGIRLLILPIVMGLGFEVIMLAGKHDNFFTRALSAPGLWVQRITTKEPTEDMLEIAIISIKGALRDEFPEFKEFFDNKGWESQQDKAPEEKAEASEEDIRAPKKEEAEENAKAPKTDEANDENTVAPEKKESTQAPKAENEQA